MNDQLRDKIATMQQRQHEAEDAERELAEAYGEAVRAVAEELEVHLDSLTSQGATMVMLPPSLTDTIVELWTEHQNQLRRSGLKRTSMRPYLARLMPGTDWRVLSSNTTPWPDINSQPTRLTVRRPTSG